jgi:hypothetical protein
MGTYDYLSLVDSQKSNVYVFIMFYRILPRLAETHLAETPLGRITHLAE